MRDDYIKALYELARDNKQILAVVADNGAIVYDRFRKDFPEQFINFGISEANMVTAAAGLASCGKIPFAYTIGCFLTMRAFEQVRNDVCLQKMNVKLIGLGAGFVYADLGPTHHATEDIALMRVLPEMIILSPADGREAQKATMAAAGIEGPVYLRLSRGTSPVVYPEDYNFILGKGIRLREGRDLSIISTGEIVYDVLQAAAELEKSGVSTRVINVHTIKPIDREIILKAASETGAILTVEEHSIIGGLGSCVAEVLLENGIPPIRFKRMGLPGMFASGYGSHEEMKEINGLSLQDIIREAKLIIRNKT